MSRADEWRHEEKWRLLRYLHSLRQHAAHRCVCVENILWKISPGHFKEHHETIGADLFVLMHFVTSQIFFSSTYAL
jgi:hypothetical protein